MLVVNNRLQCRRCRKQVGSLGREDPLEEEMAPHSSICAWVIPWTYRLQSMRSQRLRPDCAHMHTCTCTHNMCTRGKVRECECDHVSWLYSPMLPAALRACPGVSQFFCHGSSTPVQSSSTAFPCPALPIVPRTLTLPCSVGERELVSGKEMAPCAFMFGKTHWSSWWAASWRGPRRG